MDTGHGGVSGLHMQSAGELRELRGPVGGTANDSADSGRTNATAANAFSIYRPDRWLNMRAPL